MARAVRPAEHCLAVRSVIVRFGRNELYGSLYGRLGTLNLNNGRRLTRHTRHGWVGSRVSVGLRSVPPRFGCLECLYAFIRLLLGFRALHAPFQLNKGADLGLTPLCKFRVAPRATPVDTREGFVVGGFCTLDGLSALRIRIRKSVQG